MGSWLGSAHSSGSAKCLKVAQIAQTCNLESVQLLPIPEKFLLFAMMALNSLMVILEVLLS